MFESQVMTLGEEPVSSLQDQEGDPSELHQPLLPNKSIWSEGGERGEWSFLS